MPTGGIQSYVTGREDVTRRGACLLLAGHITTSRDSDAFRDSCGEGPMYFNWLPPIVGQPMSASRLRPSVFGDDL